jgi:hypothetical protein
MSFWSFLSFFLLFMSMAYLFYPVQAEESRLRPLPGGKGLPLSEIVQRKKRDAGHSRRIPVFFPVRPIRLIRPTHTSQSSHISHYPPKSTKPAIAVLSADRNRPSPSFFSAFPFRLLDALCHRGNPFIPRIKVQTIFPLCATVPLCLCPCILKVHLSKRHFGIDIRAF